MNHFSNRALPCVLISRKFSIWSTCSFNLLVEMFFIFSSKLTRVFICEWSGLNCDSKLYLLFFYKALLSGSYFLTWLEMISERLSERFSKPTLSNSHHHNNGLQLLQSNGCGFQEFHPFLLTLILHSFVREHSTTNYTHMHRYTH